MSRVTRSINHPPSSSKTKEPSTEIVNVKKIQKVKKPSKEAEIYQVEAILERKKMNGMWLYKVKWQGYSEDECTWEPSRNLDNVKFMINEFNKKWREEQAGDSESGSESEEEEPEEKVKKPKGKEKEKEKKQKEKEKEKKGKTSTDRESRREKNNKNKEERKSSVSKSPKKKLKTEKDTAVSSGSSARSEYGSLAEGDKVKKLLVAKSENSAIAFTVEWEPRKDGTIPKKSTVTNTDLRKHHKDLLLDYYEERLKFVRPASSKNTVDKSSVSKGNNEPEPEKPQENTNAMEEEKVTNNENQNEEKNNKIDVEQDNKESESKVPEPEIAENGKQQENLGPTDLIQNQGQTIFADVGDNNVQELRDLTLDSNMMIFDQAEKNQKLAEKAAEVARDEAPTESPKDIDGNNLHDKENSNFEGLEA